MSAQDERHLILEMIAAGKITAGEGLNLLKTLDENELDAAPPGEAQEAAAWEQPLDLENLTPVPDFQEAQETTQSAIPPTAEAEQDILHRLPAEIEAWRRWWVVPLWLGLSLTLLGAAWMFTAWLRSGLGFGFFLSWLPFFLGVALTALGWGARNARWLYVSVEQTSGEWPRRIAFSLPLPLSLARWGLATFGGRIPGLRDPQSLQSMIAALESKTSPENPFYLVVDEGEDGEKVHVFIA